MNIPFTDDFKLMIRCVRQEFEKPYRASYGPDWQAAINAYLCYGGLETETAELESLFHEACDELEINY